MNRRKVLILGAGKVGGLVKCLLSTSGDYELPLAQGIKFEL